MVAGEGAKQRECRLIEFIVIHEARSSSVTERYENPLLICLSWKHCRWAAWITVGKNDCVCVCLYVGGQESGGCKKWKKGEWIRTKQKKRGERNREGMQWGPNPITPVRCRLRLDHVPSQRVALPRPPPPPPSLLLTHLCSAGRHIMSPRNPLKRMSLSEQATITQTCQALPVGIKSNTSDWRHFTADNGASPSEQDQARLMSMDRRDTALRVPVPAWAHSTLIKPLQITSDISLITACQSFFVFSS